MSLVRQATRSLPWSDLDHLADRMSRIFGHAGVAAPACGPGCMPPVSVEETDGEILLAAELPGMSGDAVEIAIENNVLTISGEKPDPRAGNDDANRRLHLSERCFGAFRRSFALPRTIRADGIEAEFHNGLLTVRLPKAAEAVSRKIEVGRRTS